METIFQKDLKELINYHSIDNECHTPDYILAKNIVDYLRVYAETMKSRDGRMGDVK